MEFVHENLMHASYRASERCEVVTEVHESVDHVTPGFTLEQQRWREMREEGVSQGSRESTTKTEGIGAFLLLCSCHFHCLSSLSLFTAPSLVFN